MPIMPSPIATALLAWLSRLRFPTLLKIAAALFALDLVVPDMIPFVDEILLGLMTILLASWKRDRNRPIEVDPRKSG
jgi:hypothetical protein